MKRMTFDEALGHFKKPEQRAAAMFDGWKRRLGDEAYIFMWRRKDDGMIGAIGRAPDVWPTADTAMLFDPSEFNDPNIFKET